MTLKSLNFMLPRLNFDIRERAAPEKDVFCQSATDSCTEKRKSEFQKHLICKN